MASDNPGAGLQVDPPTDAELLDAVWAVLRTIEDPCMCLAGKDLSIVDMGVVTHVTVQDAAADIGIRFTDPSCLFELRMTFAMEEALTTVEGLDSFQINIAAHPIWTTDKLSPKATAAFDADRERLIQGRSSSSGH